VSKLTAAIVGPGNIGTDLLVKLLRSDLIEVHSMIGVDPASDGLARARELGVPASAEGVDWLIAQDVLPDLVFEATSAKAHLANAPRYRDAGITAIDLTPAATGPFVCPPVNLATVSDEPNLNMITCGGQATIPIVNAVSSAVPVPYAEIVASIASRSADPGTRANIDEFTETTAHAIEQVGGAQRGKAIIILNPVEPPMIMRDTVFCAIPADADTDAITASIEKMVEQVSQYVPGYNLRAEPQFDEPRDNWNGMAQVRGVVHALDGAGVEVIEVTHGDGLGGSSFNYGFSAEDDVKLVAAATREAKRAKIAVLLLPGVGTIEDLRKARDAGASVARIATHCTEADVSLQHFAAARDMGMETVGFLMLSHRIGPAELAKQARIMVDGGAECVYVVDSAGALVLGEAQARVAALVTEVGHQAQVGFHGHQNLSLGIANSVLAAQNGALQIDGALCALGAGAGNSPTEVLVATFERLGIPTGVDVQGALAAAEEVVRPFLHRLPFADRGAITQGYAGVYSSFLLHAEQAAERYKVPAHEILQRVGEAGYVGGQEDMIIDVALQLVAERDQAEG
jgi:4-hydroxy 2-oxovalerate aldolase